MIRFIFIPALLPGIDASFIRIDEDNLKNCATSNDDFWMVYQTHFFLVNYLTVHVLQTDDHRFELNQFAKAVMRVLNSCDYFTTKIQERFLPTEAKSSNRFVSNTSEADTDLDFVPTADFFKTKRRTSDSREGHVIVAWDVGVLGQFLDEDHRAVIPETRATYALLFIFSPSRDCQDGRRELSHVLERLWVEYNVVNVVAQTPCSCSKTQIYIYRPFVKTGESWGRTSRFSLEEVISNLGLIANPLTNFNQFPLNIAIFPRTPTAIQVLPKLLRGNPIYGDLSWSKGFAGLDGLILGTLAKHLNFDAVLVSSFVEDDFGRVLPNGTTVGSLNDIVERRAVFNANGRLLAFFFLDQVEFTIPYTTEPVCVVVPKAAKVPRWKFIFNCFQPESWICIVLTCFVCNIFWYNVGPSSSLGTVTWYIFSYLMGIPIKSAPRKIDRVLFLVPCIIFSIVILGVVQGSFFQNLTTSSYYNDINTLEEVAEWDRPIGAFVWHLVKDDSQLIRKLKSKSVEAPDNIFDLIAHQRNMVALDTKPRLELLIKSRYLDDDGLPLLHIVNECVTTFLTANIVPANSPYIAIFNEIITKLFESGLTSKWYNDVFDSMVTEKLINLNKNREKTQSISLYDAQSAFHLILVGHICSILVFLGEILSKKNCQRKNSVK
jgi:hypothetical protein